MADVITVSSDEEGTPSPKRKKTLNIPLKTETNSTINSVKDEEDSTNSTANNLKINKTDVFVIDASSDDENKVAEEDEPVLAIENCNKNGENESEEDLLIKTKEELFTENHNQSDEEEEENEPIDPVLNNAFNEFIQVCKDCTKASKYESTIIQKSSKLRSKFDKSIKLIDTNDHFKQLLIDKSESARKSAAHAVLSFTSIYTYLSNLHQEAGVEVSDEKTRRRIIKVEKTIARILKALKKCEEREVDLSDENESAYLLQDAYARKLAKVYKKYNQLLKLPQSEPRKQFRLSKYRELNRDVNKLHANNQFPSAHDVAVCVRKSVAKHGLELSESEIRLESRSMFQKMGEMLQLQRKSELLSRQSVFIENTEDPAKSDDALRGKLRESREAGAKRMHEEFEKYAKKQEELKDDVELSPDSDDSHHKSSTDTE